jgi:hypothetical protein
MWRLTLLRSACSLLRMEQRAEATQAVASRVSDQIKSCGVTVVWLCQDTGIPRATMLRRLAGHQPGFSINELDRIAKSLRVGISDLLTPITEQVKA